MNVGVALVLLFVAASALRDVFFGGVFQKYRFFEVVLVSFSLATAIFSAVVVWRMPQQVAALRRAWREGVMANLGTAAAWLSYFYALKLLEPAVVNTIHTGTGSVALIGLGAVGVHMSRPARVTPAERRLSFGVFLSLLSLSVVVLLDLSGLPSRTTGQNLIGLMLAFASGVFIALSSDLTKRMNDKGVTPEAVLAVRFIAILAVAAIAVLSGGGGGASLSDIGSLARIALAALALIVLPLYALQIGLARTSAVSVWVILAIGPCLVFAAQFLDGRLRFAPLTLTCISFYSLFAILAVLARRFERRSDNM